MRGGFELGRRAGSALRCGTVEKGIYSSFRLRVHSIRLQRYCFSIHASPICLDSVIVHRFGPPLPKRRAPKPTVLVLYRNPIQACPPHASGCGLGIIPLSPILATQYSLCSPFPVQRAPVVSSEPPHLLPSRHADPAAKTTAPGLPSQSCCIAGSTPQSPTRACPPARASAPAPCYDSGPPRCPRRTGPSSRRSPHSVRRERSSIRRCLRRGYLPSPLLPPVSCPSLAFGGMP